MKDIAFVSVAFGEQYVEQQARLRESLEKVYGDEGTIFSWTDELPTGAKPFNKSLYGFKPHAVEFVRKQGYKKICWLDTAIIVQDRIEYYDRFIKELGVIAFIDENKLSRFCSRRALRHFQVPPHKITRWNLVGGSFYYFDFNLPLCRAIFDKWMHAEQMGIFGSQRDEAMGLLRGHRHDEACMALSLYTSGSRPMSEDTRYNCQDGVMIKEHFK